MPQTKIKRIILVKTRGIINYYVFLCMWAHIFGFILFYRNWNNYIFMLKYQLVSNKLKNNIW